MEVCCSAPEDSKDENLMARGGGRGDSKDENLMEMRHARVGTLMCHMKRGILLARQKWYGTLGVYADH